MECPAGLVMDLQPNFATSQLIFITNPGAQIQNWIDMSIQKIGVLLRGISESSCDQCHILVTVAEL